jgi:23S rRNA (guanine2445-N2)-methyltransferase / 23S rRNA (guanine2069-N7)-methyltransferase
MPEHFIATAAFGLEAVVARELKQLGYPDSRAEAGSVRFVADDKAICRTNLWLRSSDRVLVEMGRFEATDFGQLFDGTVALPWERWLPADASFPVRGKSVRSQLSSVPACQRLVKKAIVDRLCKAHGVQVLPETGAVFPIQVSLLNNQVSLTIDTSGAGLHKRGYRQQTGLAPLKETLAAALIQLSYWRPDRPFLDPFCGTGTIPIEAALIGLNQAPGLHREFAAEAWPTLSAQLWREARTEARDLLRPDTELDIVGSDCDPIALRMARDHAVAAKVAEKIEWRKQDARDLRCDSEYGCIIANPPYGERLGEMPEVEELYSVLPDTLSRFATWSHYIITSHPAFEPIVGRRADRRRKLYNGRIECTYYQFHGPRPPKPGTALETSEAGDNSAPEEPGEPLPIATPLDAEAPASVPTPPAETAPASASDVPETPTPVSPAPSPKPEKPAWRPAFGGLPEKAEEQAATFRRRLEKRAHHLRRWPTKQGITCFRVYDRDVPGVPLVVDRYEDWLHITEYRREDEHVAGQHEAWLQLMVDTAADTLGVTRANTYLKARERQVGKTQHERVAEAKDAKIVHEGGLKFEINLTDYIDTGLFLDHRKTRDMVRGIARDKDVLNLFCYTGSFSVYAADGGARSTCSVDLSTTYLQWARRNFELNGFRNRDQHELIKADVLEYLRDLPAEGRFDIAIVDPPTFSNSKSTETVFDVQRDQRELLGLTLRWLRPGGICLFSNNRRKFKFEAEDLPLVAQAREITNQTLPEDFQQQGAHRCWRIVRRG